MKMASTCLQMDVGNSSAKWRLVVDGAVQARGSYVQEDAQSQQALLDCAPQVEQAWISSVASPATESRLGAMLEQRWSLKPWFARSAALSCGLKNSYAEPEKMGVDRWLAMLAGWQRSQGRVCVVDAGSALTVDIVSASGQHEGGYIVPGPVLMERALLQDTDLVRFADDVAYSLAPGQSTAEAVRHGVCLAQAGAVALALERAAAEPLDTYFCGGGGEALMAFLEIDSHYCADLVFEGLELAAGEA